jgi:hypothetical protein
MPEERRPLAQKISRAIIRPIARRFLEQTNVVFDVLRKNPEGLLIPAVVALIGSEKSFF